MIVLLFMFTGISFADRDMSHKQWQKQEKQKHRQYLRRQGPNHYGQGFRYQYHGQRHWRPRHYRGHWRSWQEWNSHRSYSPHIYNRGHYYRHGGNLYFEFRTGDGTFVFSIGR
jgi:hypothetical protein